MSRPIPVYAPPEAVGWEEHDRAALISAARSAMLSGRWEQAEAILASAPEMAHSDATCLNLRGILHEARHEWKLARRCYGRAMRAQRHYTPAEQNLRRLYEMTTFGQSRLPVAMWDLAI